MTINNTDGKIKVDTGDSVKYHKHGSITVNRIVTTGTELSRVLSRSEFRTMPNIYLILFAKIADNFWLLTIFEKF